VKSKIDAYILGHGGSMRELCLTFYRRATASDFIGKVAETFATRILLISIGLFTTVIVARILGPQGRGLFAVAAATGAIGLQFGNLGLHSSNVYYVARDRDLLSSLVGNSLLVSFVFGGFGAVVTWAVFVAWPKLAPVHNLLLILALGWIPFGLSYLLLQNLLLGIQEVRTYNKIELANQLLGVSLIGVVILFESVTVESVFSMGLVALVLSFFWLLLRLRRHFRGFPQASLALFKNTIQYGLKAYLASFFSFLVLRVDLFMVQYMLGAEHTGYYSIAAAMADMLYIFAQVVGTILFPKLSALENVQEKWQLAKKAALGTGAVMLALLSLAVVFARPIVGMLFGDAFLPSVPAFVWLAPGIFFLSLSVVIGTVMGASGMPSYAILPSFISAVGNILLNLYLIEKLGIIGAALASSITYFLLMTSTILLTVCVLLKEKE
jgi:O-antigen/teichoic acid export membrane protein